MKKFYVGGELLKKAPNCNLLYHQYRTVEALESNSVIFNTYPTGSGKTRAALQRLIDNPQDNVLFIAPTNELLVQHSEDIKEFVRENNLNFKVVRIDAKVIQKIKVDKPHLRKGTILYEVLRNPLQYKEQLGIENLKGKVVIIVNPDIFYYCLYGLYGKLDKGNLIDSIITKYNYIIIDEFHYYNSKQLTNFLFFMFLSKELGYLDGIRKFCILTATPDKLIEKYLTRGGIDYQIISPDNEPKESKDYEKLNTLSKMELVVTNGSLAETVVGYYNNRDKEEDSVVISQS
ncbi:MAG: type I-D CRISPR-associated helicase Cas3', partial [Clostridium sp.]